MTEASFEDFLSLTADRLDRAALVITNGALVSAATCGALSAVTRRLITLSSRYGQMPNGTPAATWQPVLLDRLAAADRRFRHHARADAAPSVADALIGDAARLLTVAQDLLATHLTSPDPPRQFARTPQGEELLGVPVREHLLRRVAVIIDHLAELTRTVLAFDDLSWRQPHLAQAYRPREKDLAAAALALAGAVTQCPGPAMARFELFAAPVLSAAVSYPPPNEDPIAAAELTRTALRRTATAAYQAARALRTSEHPPAHTASNLRETATHLATAHAIAADLLSRLAPHLPSVPEWNPAEGVARLRAAGAAWLRLRHTWAQTISAPDSGPRSPLTVQVTSVAIRIGRLAYSDPTWIPQAGPGRPRVIAELLLPEVLDALCITISTLPREAATIAANHARLATDSLIDLYSADRAHRPDGEGRRFFPLQPAQRAELTHSYRQATGVSGAAAAALSPISRGHQTLKATALAQPSRQALRQSLKCARQQQHQGLQNQQPGGERSVAHRLARLTGGEASAG